MKKLKIAFIAMSYVSIPGQFIPHTGMLYVSEYVRKNGFTSDVFDFSNCEVIDALSSVTKFLEYDVVLFPAYDENISNILNYSAELKKMCSDIVIILGGPSATSNASYILKNYDFIDYITLGEGEINTLNILNYLSGIDEKIVDVGIGYHKDGEILISKDYAFLENLDDAPFPYTNVTTLNNKTYDNYLINQKKALSIISSRGCPFKCSFCAIRTVQSAWRKRSINNIMEEVKYKIDKDKTDYRHIFFVDAFFSGDFSRAISIGIALKNLNSEFTFSFSTRPEFIIKNKDALNELKSVGCESIELGIENFSDRILNYYNKQIDEKTIIEAIALLQKANIHIDVDFILFSPVITLAELRYNIEKLIEFNLTNKNCIDIPFSSLALFTGTKLRYMHYKEDDLSLIDIEEFIQDKDVLIVYKIMKIFKLNYYDDVKEIIFDTFWETDFKHLNIIADILFLKIESIFADFLYYLVSNIKQMEIKENMSDINRLYQKAINATKVNSLIACFYIFKKCETRDIHYFLDILIKEKIIF